MRRFLFMLVIVIGLLLGAEISLTFLTQKGMERALSRQYGLPPDVEASIGAFPFILSLARNHLGELRFSWHGECSLASAAGAGEVSYHCVAYLYDVELSMPSLMRGNLRIDSLSRMQAYLEMEAREITSLLHVGIFSGTGDEGVIETLKDGIIYQYKVKVSGEHELSFAAVTEAWPGERGTTENKATVEGGVIRVELSGMPMEASLKKASLKGEKMELEISFPEWEGYLESSTLSLFSNHKIKLKSKIYKYKRKV